MTLILAVYADRLRDSNTRELSNHVLKHKNRSFRRCGRITGLDIAEGNGLTLLLMPRAYADFVQIAVILLLVERWLHSMTRGAMIASDELSRSTYSITGNMFDVLFCRLSMWLLSCSKTGKIDASSMS